MKVLFLNYEYPPLGGGAGNATKFLLREFAKRSSLEVHLVTSAVGDRYSKEHIGGNVFVHFLPIGKTEATLHAQSQTDLLRYSVAALRFSSRFVREAKREGKPFEATIAFFGIPCGAIAWWLKWRYGLPYIVSLRGSDVPGYSAKYSVLYRLLTPLIRWIWKNASFVVPNSEGLRVLANKSAPLQEMVIIPNGVAIDSFSPHPEARSSEVFLVTNGATRVTPRKGIRYLILAIAELAPRYPQLRLKVIGDGDEKTSLEELVRERGLEGVITFVGRQPAEKTPPYYAEANVFVLPSLNEGMSNAMLEALASGLPIIATDTGGTSELVREGENGCIVPEKDSHAIAQAIERLLLDPAVGVRMGQASRRRAEAMSWEFVAGKFEELLHRAIARS